MFVNISYEAKDAVNSSSFIQAVMVCMPDVWDDVLFDLSRIVVDVWLDKPPKIVGFEV